MWKKGLIGVLIITLVVIVSVIVWKLNAYFSMSAEERFFYKELKSKLNKGKREIFIKDLTNFDWDGVRFVGGYGGKYKPNSNFYIDGSAYLYKGRKNIDLMDDGLWALFFVNNEKKEITNVILGNRWVITYNRKIIWEKLWNKKSKLLVQKIEKGEYQFLIGESE